MTEESSNSVPEPEASASKPATKRATTRKTTTRVAKATTGKTATAKAATTKAATAKARRVEAEKDGDAAQAVAEAPTPEGAPPEPAVLRPAAPEPVEPGSVPLPPALAATIPTPVGAERHDYQRPPASSYTPPVYTGPQPRVYGEQPPVRPGSVSFPERAGFQGVQPAEAHGNRPAPSAEAGFVPPIGEVPLAPGEVGPPAGGPPPVVVRNYPVPASVQMQEMREMRDERPIEPRGLRFRGRDGRTELRGRMEPPARNFRGRPDNRPAERGPEPRGDGRRFESDPTGRIVPVPRPEPYRGEPRNDVRAEAPPRDVPPRDAGVRETARPEARVMERDVVRGRNNMDLTTLEEMNVSDLRELAKDLNIPALPTMKKTDIVFRILEAQAETSGNLFKKGFLEILPDGKGFLRTEGYLPGNEDVYVSQSQIKRFNLKTGDNVSGQVRAPKEMERYYGLLRVEAINGEAPEAMRTRKEFEKLTPIFPDEKFKLETTQENITARIIDLVTPIGKGQRGLIVAPPKAGKTSLIKNIANSIAANHPDVYLIVLLIDERPEEVTDISRSVKGEVVASTFDEMPENHMRVADMVMEKAKRMVEQKHDVVILLDSITRLSRASNLVVTPSGRTLTGGLDPAAMYRPKRMFGAARNIEEGGSLTILATTLVDTGSRMDDMIFEEFKGTGNLDLVLDRSLFDQRIFPSIDINKSGTRRDDLLLSKEDLAATFHLRRTLAALDNDKAILLLIDRLKNTKTNDDFMQIVQKSSRQAAQS